jgi:hypothetical protein
MSKEEEDKLLDKMHNETSPGVQCRRFRLQGISKNRDGEHIAMLELVPRNPDDDLIMPFRVIWTMFLPHTFREQLIHDVDPLPGFPDKEDTPIEYEITVRRVESTPGFVSKITKQEVEA